MGLNIRSKQKMAVNQLNMKIIKIMKIKFSSDDNLPLNKILRPHMLTVIAGSVFQKNGKYYLQVLLDECFYEF